MVINVDLSATAFYEKGPLLQMVAKLLGRRTPDDLHCEVTRIIKRLKDPSRA